MTFVSPRKCADILWSEWHPTIRATLVFVVKDAQILLMLKKRGLGEGKINGPGGKVEDGESARDCAVREAQEELHITPVDPVSYGILRFQFVDGFAIHCEVFRANDLIGEPTETEEGAPFWCPVAEIPYEKMWRDDRYWLPLLLEKRSFEGNFLFDGDEMLDLDMTVRDGPN